MNEREQEIRVSLEADRLLRLALDNKSRKRFEAYSDEDLQSYNGDNAQTLKNWNRKDAIEEAVITASEEWMDEGK